MDTHPLEVKVSVVGTGPVRRFGAYVIADLLGPAPTARVSAGRKRP
jgi:hypothetical protein